MDFVGNGQRLSEADYAAAARAAGIKPATIKGVVDVEAAGHGFDSKNRPKILTEPHIFYRELGPGKKRDQAEAEGIAYPHWGTRPYPATSDGNYARLEQMIAIDETAALKSTSWGLTQILGTNHADAGFHSPQDMVEAFKQGEDDQLLAFMHLVETWGLLDELQRRDAAGFARRYNGAGFARNGYDRKLRDAWTRRDREASLAPPPSRPVPTAETPISSHDLAPTDGRDLPPPVKTPPVGTATTHSGAAGAAAVAVVGAASHLWWLMALGALLVVAFVVATHFIRKARVSA